jgi:HrpA-like RNA helicase
MINKYDSTRWQKGMDNSSGKEVEIQEEKELPIIYHEREIMESLETNLVTIVCGETGSGKSTQIP